MSNPFVVKVQKSLSSSLDYRSVLMYDASRTVEWQGKLEPDIDKLVPSEREFFWAILYDDGNVGLQGEPITKDAEASFERFDFPTMNPKEQKSDG